MRHINTWSWRKKQGRSETTFLIGIKFHRKENNAELEGFFEFKSYIFFISLKITKIRKSILLKIILFKFERTLENIAYWVWFWGWLVGFFSGSQLLFKSFKKPGIFETTASR